MKNKILQFIKNNKEWFIAIVGMTITEVALYNNGYKMGCKDGWQNGASEVMNDIIDMDDNTHENVKEHLINNKGYTIIEETKK